MALEDKDLFNAIFNKYSDQPIEFVMEQYEKAKILNLEIERRQSLRSCVDITPSSVAQNAEELKQIETTVDSTPKKKFTKRDLVIKPNEAITDEAIKCCLCGKERSSLTLRHLATHGISVDEYKKLCGYAPGQKLMSNNHAKKVCDNVMKAQQARGKVKKDVIIEKINKEYEIYIFIKKLCCRTLDVHSIAFLFLSDMRICHAAGFYQKILELFVSIGGIV